MSTQKSIFYRFYFYNFNKIIFDLEVPVNTLFKIFMKLGFEYFYILYILIFKFMEYKIQ